MPSKVSHKSLKAKADKLCRRLVFERDVYCQCNGPHGRTTKPHQHSDVLQWAHIVSRKYLITRADPLNSIVLCSACHMFFTHNPEEWLDWVDAKYPGLLGTLRDLIRKGYKPDYEILIPALEKQWEDLSKTPTLQRKSSPTISQKDTPSNG